MAFNPLDYPPNWKEIVAQVRARARDRCECAGECGLHRGRRCAEINGNYARWAKGKVVLTTAHLNYPGGPCQCEKPCGNLEHLKAMCSKCHLLTDRVRHQRNAAKTRQSKQWSNQLPLDIGVDFSEYTAHDKKEIQRARGMAAKAIKSGKIVRPDKCSRCGEKCKPDGHHEDYAKPFTLLFLCRKCHMTIDGRLRFMPRPKAQAPKRCQNCRVLSKPMRRGLCHRCNEYQRRYGVARPYESDGRRERFAGLYRKKCERCGRSAGIVGPPTKTGLCRSCYVVLWRQRKRDAVIPDPRG